MSGLTQSDVRDFHTDLMTAQMAGIPLNVGFSTGQAGMPSSGSMRESLNAIESILTRACADGESIEQVLESDERFSRSYCSALRVWFESGRAPVALESLSEMLAEERRCWSEFALSLVLPTIWLVLAYLAMLFIVGGLVPLFEMQSRQMLDEPGPVLKFLQAIRAWMPLWSVAVPVLLIAALISLRARSQRRMQGQLSSLNYAEALRRSQLAEHASQWIAGGMPTEQAIESLCDMVGAEDQVVLRDRKTTGKPRIDSLPPLFAWAVSAARSQDVARQQEPTVADAVQTALHQTASIYREIANQLAGRHSSQTALRIGLAIVGGVLVMGVALTVFGPLIEMMLSLSAPVRS